MALLSCITPYLEFCHGGGYFVMLLLVALAQASLVLDRPLILLFLGITVLLGAASDALILVTFVFPALGSLVFAFLRDKSQIRRVLSVGLTIALSSIVGWLLAQVLFPVPLHTGDASIKWGVALDTLNIVAQNIVLLNYAGAFRSWLLVLDIALVVLLAWRLRPGGQAWKLPSPLFFIVVFGGLLIVINWSAAILCGSYSDKGGTRYVVMALLFPGFLLLGWLAETISWQQRTRQGLALAVAAVTLGISLFPPAPSIWYEKAEACFPVIRGVMNQEHIEVGLSHYWVANCMTFLSHQTVPSREINPDGTILRWFNNEKWYEGDGNRPSSGFRFVIMDLMETGKLVKLFGPPDRILQIPDWSSLKQSTVPLYRALQLPDCVTIWIYSPEHAIRYNPIFNQFGTAPRFPTPNEIRLPASTLGQPIGKIEGDSIVVREGQSKENFLTAGIAAQPPAGCYQVVYAYTYEKAPAPGREVTFDCVIWSPTTGAKIIDQAPLPYLNANPQRLTRDIIVSEKESRDPLEARLYWHGSGDIRVDSLSLIYLPSPAEFRFPASTFGQPIGTIEGDSVVVREGQSKENFLTAGIAAHPPAGRYRVVYTYAYEKAPAPGREVTFDCVIWNPTEGGIILDKASLPYLDTTTQRLTRDIVVPEKESQNPFEARLYWRGSGDIRVDSLSLTYLGN